MSEINTTGPDALRIDSLPVSDGGRITIPKDIRTDRDLVPNGLVTVRLLLDDETETFNKPLVSGGRVTIPSRIRNEHSIEDGDKVNVEIVA